MAAEARIHNFAFFLLTFYFPNWPINQFESIMQNKPNLLNAQMNVNTIITKDYENESIGNLAKTNPIKPKNPNFSQIRIISVSNPVKFRKKKWQVRVNY